MHLLERDATLAALTEYADDARSGSGRMVLVSGEAGGGKTALIEEFSRGLSGAHYAAGACDGLFTPRPLGPLFEIAEQLGGDLLAACRRGAPRDELFAALLRRLAEPGQLTVLSVEDVHWADEATLDLLRFLGRRIRTAPVLLMVTYRDEGLAADDPLRILLGALAAERAVRRVRVAALSEEAVARLAATSAISALELHHLTGGNPFFVTEVLRGGSAAVPDSARDAVLSRLALLSDASRDAAEVAALAGTRVEPALLGAAGGVSARDLDELLRCGVLVSEGTSLRFRHEITRLSVEREVPAHRRRSICASLLAALRRGGDDEEGQDEDDARLAFLAEGAGDRDAVVLFAPRAGARAAELGAHREAAAQYERAVRFAGDGADQVVAELNDQLAGEAALIDRWDLAAAAGERASAAWRAVGNVPREGDSIRALSRTMWRLCRGLESLSHAEQAVDTLEPLGPTPELAWAYAHLAAIRMHRGERERGWRAAARAVELAERFGLHEVIGDGLATEPCFAQASGQDWQSAMRRSLRNGLDSGSHQQAARAYANMAVMLCAAKRFDTAGAYVVQGLAFCAEHDVATFGLRLQATYGELLLDTGRWDEALETCRAVLDRPVSPLNRIAPALVVGRILARRGAPDAWPHLHAAVAGADGADQPDVLVATRLSRAEASWLAGDQSGAVRDVAVGAGAAVVADEWVRGLLASWQRRLGVPVTVPTGEVAEPYQMVLRGDFDAAAQLWDRTGCPYDAALALYDSATEDGLRAALARFDELGASAAALATRREMRRLRLRAVRTGPHQGTRAHPAGLTRREHEVLRLLCAGDTNGDISARLVISPRTVDHHVSAVLTKLGVASRRAAADKARRLGLLDLPADAPPAAGKGGRSRGKSG